MQIIDLTQQIYSGMPVFPGDPEVEIEDFQTFEKDSWNMKRIHMSLHDGTHVNVPIHGTKNGKNMDSYQISDFVGETILFEKEKDIKKGIGIIFSSCNIDWDLVGFIEKRKPKFVGLSEKFEFDVEIEKYLLEKEMISFERLANTEKLPKKFMFFGVPLNVKQADGSPVRAFAEIN